MSKKNKYIFCESCKNKIATQHKYFDFIKQNNYFTYYCCIKCSLIQLYPLPVINEVNNFYKKNTSQYQFTSYSPLLKFAYSNVLGKYLISKYLYWAYIKRVNLVKKYASYGKILDIGCAQGNFLSFFPTKFWNKSGVEINPYLAKIARTNNPSSKIINSSFEETNFSLYKYHVVTLWHVFEHMSNPQKILHKISRLMKQHGYLIIELPNGQSWYGKLFGKYWQLLLPGEHLYFWTRKSLSYLLKKNGFEIINTTYPIFDSSFPGSLVIYLQHLHFPAKIAVILGLLFWPISIYLNIFLSNKRDNLLIVARKK